MGAKKDKLISFRNNLALRTNSYLLRIKKSVQVFKKIVIFVLNSCLEKLVVDNVKILDLLGSTSHGKL